MVIGSKILLKNLTNLRIVILKLIVRHKCLVEEEREHRHNLLRILEILTSSLLTYTHEQLKSLLEVLR